MGRDCMSIAQSTGAMPLEKKYDGSSLNDEKFEGPEAPNVGPR